MASSCTGPAQVVRCDRCQTTAFRVFLHNCPDHLGRKTVSRDSACLIDGPQQWTRIYTGSKTPTVGRLLHPCRNGNGPDMAAFRKVCIIKLSHSGRSLRSVHRKRSDPFPPPGPARVSQTRTVSAAPRRIVTISASLGLRRSQPRRGRGRACVCVGTGFERLAYEGPNGLGEALERLLQFPSPAQDS